MDDEGQRDRSQERQGDIIEIDGETYYTVASVGRVFGISQAEVYRRANEGSMPWILPAGKKIGRLFPREAIDELAKRARQEHAKKQVVHYSFVPSTVDDLWVAIANARRNYGPDDTISFERALDWRTVNPDISRSVHQLDQTGKRSTGKSFAGMITFLPLEEEVIAALLEEKIREKDIPLKAIKPWGDPHISVYMAGIAAVPVPGDEAQTAQRGRFLLTHSIQWAIALQAQYSIKNWYGIAVTPKGRLLAETLSFRPVIDLEGGQRVGYVLDNLFKNPSEIIRHYLNRAGDRTDPGEISDG